jgi:nucleotide-binding universal stress UspA family protein
VSTPDTDPTPPPGRIVVGVDGSPHSRQALLWALHQGRLTGQPVEAVTSWSIPVDWGVGGVGNVLTIDWAGQAAATLAETVGSLGDEPGANRVVQHVVMGHPARVLLDAAADADLLVVGSRGRGGFAGMLLGSVSQHVVPRSPCPVVVVHGEERPAR